MNDLERAAMTAGLKDPALLKIVDPALAPDDALAALKAKYPGAFHGGGNSTASTARTPGQPAGEGFNLRHASPAQMREFERQNGITV